MSRLSDIALPDITLPDVPNEDCPITASTTRTPVPSLPEFTLPEPGQVPAILNNLATSDSRNVVQVEDKKSIKLQGPEAKAKTLGEFKMCTLCNIHLNSKVQADMHYAGKLHQRKLKQKALAESPDFNLNVSPAESKDISCNNVSSESTGGMVIRHCDICGLTFTGLSQVQAHLTGARHAKKLRQIAQTKAAEESQEEGGLFYCKPCKKSCTSQAQLDQHCQGSKHKHKMGVAMKASDPTANTAMYVCSACNINTNSEQQYLQHCEGAAHKAIVRYQSYKSNTRHEPYPTHKGVPPAKGNYTSKNFKGPNQRNRFIKSGHGNNYRPAREQNMGYPTNQDMDYVNDSTPYNNTSEFAGRFDGGLRNMNFDESSGHLSQTLDRGQGWNEQYSDY